MKDKITQKTVSDSEYSVNYSDNKNAGTATVTVSDKTGGNYNVSGVKTFTIARAKATVTATDKSKTYGESDPKLEATVSGLVNGEAANLITYTLSRAKGEDVGTYTITPAGDKAQGNY